MALMKVYDGTRWRDIPAIVGAKGDKGDKGEQGEQGIQGVQGEQGIQGEKGDKGDTGNVMFATFTVDPQEGVLIMTTPAGYFGPQFSITEEGMLMVTING